MRRRDFNLSIAETSEIAPGDMARKSAPLSMYSATGNTMFTVGGDDNVICSGYIITGRGTLNPRLHLRRLVLTPNDLTIYLADMSKPLKVIPIENVVDVQWYHELRFSIIMKKMRKAGSVPARLTHRVNEPRGSMAFSEMNTRTKALIIETYHPNATARWVNYIKKACGVGYDRKLLGEVVEDEVVAPKPQPQQQSIDHPQRTRKQKWVEKKGGTISGASAASKQQQHLESLQHGGAGVQSLEEREEAAELIKQRKKQQQTLGKQARYDPTAKRRGSISQIDMRAYYEAQSSAAKEKESSKLRHSEPSSKASNDKKKNKKKSTSQRRSRHEDSSKETTSAPKSTPQITTTSHGGGEEEAPQSQQRKGSNRRRNRGLRRSASMEFPPNFLSQYAASQNLSITPEEPLLAPPLSTSASFAVLPTYASVPAPTPCTLLNPYATQTIRLSTQPIAPVQPPLSQPIQIQQLHQLQQSHQLQLHQLQQSHQLQLQQLQQAHQQNPATPYLLKPQDMLPLVSLPPAHEVKIPPATASVDPALSLSPTTMRPC